MIDSKFVLAQSSVFVLKWFLSLVHFIFDEDLLELSIMDEKRLLTNTIDVIDDFLHHFSTAGR